MHTRQALEHLRQLGRLHPIAADFHLFIEATEEFDLTIGAQAHAVATAVIALILKMDKTLRCQLRQAQIAVGQTGTGDQQLTRHAKWQAGELLVDHPHPTIGQRPTDS